MELPVRIDSTVSSDPVIHVDGAYSGSGLELSHWPGNRTPRALRHDLSTGSALAFARLSRREREELAGDAVAIVNNHYDTDGVLALFAVRHPESALARERAMLEAAEAGDFFHVPSDRGLALDAIVAAIGDRRRSPIRSELEGIPEDERHTLAMEYVLDRLPSLLDGDLAGTRELWEPVVARAREDLEDLARSRCLDLPAADLCVFRSNAPWRGPGRHALFAATDRDRVLVCDPLDGGYRYRLVISTLSWFDLSRPRLPRPDLEALARELARADRESPSESEARWHTQDAGGPSPELWFGTQEVGLFAEHSDALRPSALAPEDVVRIVERHAAASLLGG